jgi:hypothetical protein
MRPTPNAIVGARYQGPLAPGPELRGVRALPASNPTRGVATGIGAAGMNSPGFGVARLPARPTGAHSRIRDAGGISVPTGGTTRAGCLASLGSVHLFGNIARARRRAESRLRDLPTLARLPGVYASADGERHGEASRESPPVWCAGPPGGAVRHSRRPHRPVVRAPLMGLALQRIRAARLSPTAQCVSYHALDAEVYRFVGSHGTMAAALFLGRASRRSGCAPPVPSHSRRAMSS